MAPRKRAPRDTNTTSKVLPSIETDGDPASPLRESSNSDETGHPQRYKSWTPGPPAVRNPRNEQEVVAWEKGVKAWGRKHFGERWYELHEARESEKDHLKDPLKFYDMFEEMNRIVREKELEHEREKKATLGRAYVPNIFIPLSDTDSDPASPHHDNSDGSVASDDTYRIPFSDTDSDKSEPMPEDPWERLEYARRHLHLYQSEEEYQEARARVEVIVEKQRKEKELERMKAAEEMAIRRLANTDPLESERRMRVHRLRYKDVLPWGLAGVVRFGHVVEVLTEEQAQEQIEAEDREEAAARERRMNEPPPKCPLTQEEFDAQHRTWDAWGVSKEEQAELVRMFGLKPEPEPEPGIADAPASERVSQPRASSPRPPKDTSRKTRGGRITKSTAQIQSVANRGTRSRQTGPTPSEAPMPNRRSKRQKASDMVDKPEDRTVQVSRQTRKRQPKVHKERVSGAVDDMDDKVLQSKHHDTGRRASRRLAHKPPQFGMFAEQSMTPPLHEPLVRNPSNASKPNSSGLRNRAPPKKSIAAKGAKPRGISKSGREGTNRPKSSKKRSED